MAKDLSRQIWHGIPRTEIPWYPSINEDRCIGCELCYVSCFYAIRCHFDGNRRCAGVPEGIKRFDTEKQLCCCGGA